MNKKLLANFQIALEAVLANQLRSLLTALGIIFGVAAVIAMLAIGNGAEKEILEQIKMVGVNNIIIEPVVEQEEKKIDATNSKGEDKKKFSPGLRIADAQSIFETIPDIQAVSPECVMETVIIKDGFRRSAKLVGVMPSYFDIGAFALKEGNMFSESQIEGGLPVCIIGKSIKARFFSKEDPIGKTIKVGNQWLEVVGVLDERLISEKNIAKLGIRDYNMDVYVPVKTFLIRYRNRELITEAILKAASRNNDDNGNSSDKQPSNYHQIDRLVIQVKDASKMQSTAEIISRMIERRHFGVIDYEITIPELLLKQQQRTQNIFNIVLGAIAGISLLVGGIGIMNIMLASVMERIKEIGLRLSIGAQKTDIVTQFLFEAMMISVSGGIVGVVLGISLALGISSFGDFPTIITFSSVIVSFGVAATVGLVFGIAPAQKAASQDPITSLRYE
ncbi:MAG: ABC transporter permease [Imperialibacter sp.]|uniref:ABC transporter permease n=1 Tax=Imperialibacter sp. TaxID=2038411 RepID=UPI0032EBB759